MAETKALILQLRPKREEYRAKIEKAFDTEDMFNAWCNLSLEMLNA